MVWDVWEREAAELPTRVRCCWYHRDFMVVMRQNGQELGEEDARKGIHVKPQKVEDKHQLGAGTSQDTGLLEWMVICRVPGH